MITLLLDAGNSRLKWALKNDDRPLAQGAVAYSALGEARHDWQKLPRPARVLGCNVAGPVVRGQLQDLLAPQDIDWLKSTASLAGVNNLYTQPTQLGADRFAALIGARGLAAGEDLIVAMAGTALTVDALTGDGDFLGGIIAPGFQLMRKALAKGTADLGLPDGEATPFPRSTGEAIVKGALAAMAGAIEIQRQTLEVQRERPATLLLSGGDATLLLPLLQPTLKSRLLHVDNLVLAGLARLAATRENLAP